MTHKPNTVWRFFLIRFTFPLLLLSVLWSSPGPHWLVKGLLLLSMLDFAGGIIQFLWQPRLLDYRFAVARDVLYALTFYFSVLLNPQISALILIPSVLAEVFVLFGYRAFFQAVLGEVALLVIRMTTVHHIYHQLHPAWALLICTASIIMGLLGLEITRLGELQASNLRQQEELQDTLTELLATTLSPSGIDERFLEQENINGMLKEICQDASQSKGREIGEQLAKVIAIQQAASRLLTSRELEVLRLVSGNRPYSQIARQLQVSEGTVRAHAASIMRKAGVHSRDELVLWGRNNCILTLSGLSTE